MRKVINIQIPEPCHEDWNTMTPQDKGRHCAVCSKTVVDFSKSTDEQIISTLEHSNKLCGRFRSNQLNRDMVLSRMEKNNYVSIAATGLLAFLSLGSHQQIQAQGTPKVIQQDSTQQDIRLGKIALPVKSEILVNGTVFGENSYRIPNAFINIKGTDKQVKTDFGGEFKLQAKIGDTLIIKSYSYEPQELKVSDSDHYKITLIPSTVSVSFTTGTIHTQTDDTETYTVVLGGIVGGVEIETYSSKERRKLVRKGIIERTATGKLLYKFTNIFRKK